MPKNFDLAALVERKYPNFDDEDGTEYIVKYTIHFSPEDIVELERVHKVREGNGNRRQSDKVRARRLDKATDEMFALVLPTMPAKRRAEIPFMLKTNFLNWWAEQEGEVGLKDPEEIAEAINEAMTEEELADLGEESES